MLPFLLEQHPFPGDHPQHGVFIHLSLIHILQFASGAVGTLFTTFDVHYWGQARLEVYGAEGTLVCPDPNGFGGPVELYRPEDGTRRELPLLFPYAENSRALGLADMAKACLLYTSSLLS